MGKLDGKVVIVTGSSRGIGAEIARIFAAEGGKIVCAARTLHEGEHPLRGLAREDGRRHPGGRRRSDAGRRRYLAAGGVREAGRRGAMRRTGPSM